MPLAIDLKEMQTAEMGGVPFAVARGRGGSIRLYVAAFDADGLMEGPEDCLAAAKRYAARIDKPPSFRKDY